MTTRTLPAPAEETLGVWSTPLPFPSPLGFAFSYLVRFPDGVIAVDAGWDSPESWDAFTAGLHLSGHTLDDLRGLVVTHVHPDHYGLAARIRHETSAWIALHPAERPRIAATAEERRLAVADVARWLREAGTPDDELDALHAQDTDLLQRLPAVQPDHDLLDGAAVPGTDGALIAVHTPGHTAGHLCFHDRSRNVVFTGDHVLPRVTPNISKRPGSDEDPLARFDASLRRLYTYDGARVMPGHEWPFTGLGTRLEELRAHHTERLTEIESTVHAGARTVWEVAAAVHWSRPFAGLAPRAKRSAVGETHAHLRRLAADGRLLEQSGTPIRWSPVIK
ncbi:MBL fold metallo-hydrolase [Streptomyces sp. NPDC056983]|uniref:MBL fold metallo-hydrolase n=1 Tax=Streptomyces sp. NPDC056983 TaxID=3345987 RepID=UPI0036281055